MIRWCEEVWRGVSDAELLALFYKGSTDQAERIRKTLQRHPDFHHVFKGEEHSALVAEMAWRWAQVQPPLHRGSDEPATQRYDDDI
jgi:hypothetical protein